MMFRLHFKVIVKPNELAWKYTTVYGAGHIYLF